MPDAAEGIDMGEPSSQRPEYRFPDLPIGAYHEPPFAYFPDLPHLQEWASVRGLAGTDLPWCFASFTRMPQPRWLEGIFACPCCRTHFPVVEVAAESLRFSHHVGLCGGCGTVWWS